MSVPDAPQFRYHSGEAVMEGDEVVCDGIPAFVESIFAPQTAEAADFSCADTGGILLKEHTPVKFGRMIMTPPDGELWEDLDFVRRK